MNKDNLRTKKVAWMRTIYAALDLALMPSNEIWSALQNGSTFKLPTRSKSNVTVNGVTKTARLMTAAELERLTKTIRNSEAQMSAAMKQMKAKMDEVFKK